MSDPLAQRLTDAAHDDLAVWPLADDEMVPAEPQPMVSRSVRLPLDLYEWLVAEAERRGVGSWSELARSLIEAGRHVDRPSIPADELLAFIRQHAA